MFVIFFENAKQKTAFSFSIFVNKNAKGGISDTFLVQLFSKKVPRIPDLSMSGRGSIKPPRILSACDIIGFFKNDASFLRCSRTESVRDIASKLTGLVTYESSTLTS